MTWLSRSPIRWLSLGLFLATLAVAAPVAAQTSGDDDGDGIANEVDDCPDTPAGDMVGDDGCSVCDCDADADGNDWGSHQAYVACVATEVHARRTGGTMKAKAARQQMRHAKDSSCGDPDLTRCCIPLKRAASTSRCIVMSTDRCGTLGDHDDAVQDVDSGSCLPNPCGQ